MPLVSYGAWPGDQGRFYSREAEPRVPASRRDAASVGGGGAGGERRGARAGGKSGARRGTSEDRGVSAKGKEARGRQRRRERKALQREGERDGPSYNALLVHCPERDEARSEARRAEEKGETDTTIEREGPSTRSFQPRFGRLSLTRVCLAASLRGPFVLVSLREEIKRGTRRGKGRQKEGVRREKRVSVEDKGNCG